MPKKPEKPKETTGYSPFQQWLKDLFMKNKEKAGKRVIREGKRRKK